MSYRLSESAAVSFRVERALPGRRARGRCVRPKPSNRRAKRCTRYQTLRGRFTHQGIRGKNRFTFSGRLGARKLRPGRYRLRAVATDSTGNNSRPQRKSFRVAAAVTPRAGRVYGGSTSQDQAVSMWLTNDGRKLGGFLVQLNYTCESSGRTPLAQAWQFAPTRIRKDGSFAFDSGPIHRHGDNRMRLTLTGSIGSARAGGRLRFFGVARDATGNVVDRCDSGSVRWSARRGRGSYAGNTSSRFAVSIRFSRQTQKIRSFFIDLAFKCGSTYYLYSLKHLNVAVGRRGGFSKRGFTGIPLKLPGGKASGQFALRGQFSPKGATGTYRAFGTLILPDNSKLRCDTGTVRWTARQG